MSAHGSNLEYTSTGTGCALPLTVMACAPSWDDYFDLNETIPEMTQCLIDEDERQTSSALGEGAAVQKDDSIKIVALPPNDDTVLGGLSLHLNHLIA